MMSGSESESERETDSASVTAHDYEWGGTPQNCNWTDIQMKAEEHFKISESECSQTQ